MTKYLCFCHSNSFIKCALHLDLVMSIHLPAGLAGPAFSILDVMRVAQLASCDLRRNISKSLPANYTPLDHHCRVVLLGHYGRSVLSAYKTSFLLEIPALQILLMYKKKQ